MSRQCILENDCQIVAPFQGANHFLHPAPGFLAPPGLRHPGLIYVMPLRGCHAAARLSSRIC